MRIRLLAAAVATAVLAACGSSGSGPVAPAYGDRAAAQRAPRTAQSTTVVYGGGPVQTAPRVYVVFWGSAWNTAGGDPNGVAARVKAFYGAIGGGSWLETETRFTQSNGQHVGNPANLFGGSYVDTTSAPPHAPSQAQLAAEAAKAAAHFGSASINTNYVVALPHGVAPAGFGTQYCAYHATTSPSGSTIAWTNLPYVPDAGANCGAGAVNQPGTLDGVSLAAGAQQADTMIDPDTSTGWHWIDGTTVNSRCAWVNLIDNPAAGGFPTQPLWNTATGTCVQSS
jgi:hypothetical protein